MRWYALAHFPCPRCAQRLAVEHGQVRRREVVSCQNCNADIQLIARGEGDVQPAVPADGSPSPMRVELAV